MMSSGSIFVCQYQFFSVSLSYPNSKLYLILDYHTSCHETKVSIHLTAKVLYARGFSINEEVWMYSFHTKNAGNETFIVINDLKQLSRYSYILNYHNQIWNIYFFSPQLSLLLWYNFTPLGSSDPLLTVFFFQYLIIPFPFVKTTVTFPWHDLLLLMKFYLMCRKHNGDHCCTYDGIYSFFH